MAGLARSAATGWRLNAAGQRPAEVAYARIRMACYVNANVFQWSNAKSGRAAIGTKEMALGVAVEARLAAVPIEVQR